ncbi:hypothetical protein GCM10018773_59870 [Streptomyces candidus]|nr:hypothetical protein GCM10018773_59870 [Streptomyces candidus]
MSVIFLAVSVVMALVLGVVGVLAVVADRVALPWLNRGVKRPGMWGAGALLLAGALATARIMPFEGTTLLMLSGLVLIGLAQVLGSQKARAGWVEPVLHPGAPCWPSQARPQD